MARSLATLALLGIALLPEPAVAQPGYDPSAVLAEQRAAMERLSAMDGIWRGSAWTLLPDGGRHTLTQTERVGTMLDGTLRVIEGRGYEANGALAFNAFAVLSYDASADAFRLRSHAEGRQGDFSVTATDDGLIWEVPAGPMTIRYTATIRDGRWTEVGERIVPGAPPVQFLEMNLTRIGDTDWPAAGSVDPR